MNVLLQFPIEYTKADYTEYLLEDGNEMAVLLDEVSDEGYEFWVDGQQELDYEYFLEEVQSQLDKTKIKKGFLEIENGGWQKKHGMTLPFEITAKNVWQKLTSDTDVSVKVFKEGKLLKFMRYSHDEPTGASVTLHSMKDYDSVKKAVWK